MSGTARSYTVDVIGQEVVPVTVACVDVLAEEYGFSITWRGRDWGSDYYRRHGRMMPVDGIEQLASGHAVLLGAVGAPDIPDDVTLWGLLIPIRREFQQYVNLRPIRILPGVVSPLRELGQLNVVVRENLEGEYSEIGGRLNRGLPGGDGRPGSRVHSPRDRTRRPVRRGAVATAARSPDLRDEVERHYPHDAVLGRGRPGRRGPDPGVEVERVLIDALAARVVLRPSSLDVVVASNLFGDVLSDLIAAVAGSIGVAPSGSLNPPRQFPSMFGAWLSSVRRVWIGCLRAATCAVGSRGRDWAGRLDGWLG